MFCYHLGYWVNQYANWYKIRSFTGPRELVQWLNKNSDGIEKIDFIAFRID